MAQDERSVPQAPLMTGSKNATKLLLPIVGLFALLRCATLATLSVKHRSTDGPSFWFPGSKLVSSSLHQGADADWSFTDRVGAIEPETSDPVSSRRVFAMENGGKTLIGFLAAGAETVGASKPRRTARAPRRRPRARSKWKARARREPTRRPTPRRRHRRGQS